MNIFNNDFKDFILYLNQYEVEYIVVGGYAVIIRGYSRSTGDIDIWVNKTEENFIKLQKAIKAFGAQWVVDAFRKYINIDISDYMLHEYESELNCFILHIRKEDLSKLREDKLKELLK